MNKEYKRVNWADGIEIGSSQFQQTEDYFTNSVCDALAVGLNRNNFGLLPSSDRKSDASEFDINQQVTGTVEVKLRKCNAITVGGCRINYIPSLGDVLTYTYNFDTEKENDSSDTLYWDVVITVDPFKRIPSGTPSPESTPPYHPDVDTLLNLSIVPKGDLKAKQLGMHHLVIGRIRYFNGRYTVDSNFIPPCTSMASHTDLIHYYEQFSALMNELEKASKTIIAKIRNRTQNSPIANHIGAICEDMMRYIASIYFNYRNIGPDATPMSIVNYFSSLAHISYVSMSFIDKIEREELLRYFYEWSDIKPGVFEELLSSTLGIIYDHNNIRAIMIQVESYLKIMCDLWVRLSTLEYIGQHKENIVVAERRHEPIQTKRTGGWTILD